MTDPTPTPAAPDWRALLAIYVHAHRNGNAVPPHIDAQARAALATTPPAPTREAIDPDADDVQVLAAIVREVDGSNRLGAAALAEAILSHPLWPELLPSAAPTREAAPRIWTEGIMGDGACILRDGEMVPIEEVIRALNRPAPAPAEQQVAVTLTALLHPAYECGDGSADGAQLVDEEWWHPIMGCDSLQEVVDNARAVWARAQGASPGAEVVAEISDEELLRTYGLAKRNHCYEGPIDDWPKRAERAATVCGLRAVLARYARPAIQPVPVSERLPEKKDLDKNGRCWVYLNERTTTHWLPHWALPVPAADQQEGQGDA